jgi:hypothetical protein
MANDLELVKRKRLKDDLTFYAKNCLQIRGKEKIQYFELNKAQLYIHEILEKQLKETGRVRAIILKGRQQGVSTYAEARFIWRVTHSKGVRAFILTQEEAASQTLFEMAKRYYDNLPEPVKPTLSASNSKELHFDKLDSGYKIGTAGNKSVGRSQTNQFFHGSEVAFWPNAAEHAKGILQTVPNSNGTEIIYESTANGVGNFFHEQWKLAESGESDFIPIFIPWYWQEEYTKEAPEDFALSEDEELMVEAYGINPNQLSWRRQKVIELSAGGMDGEKAFMQEYPFNAVEAFQVSGGDGLIKASYVLKARNNEVNGNGSLIVGVDPSRGGDRFSLIKRHGRKAYDLKKWKDEEIDSLGKAVSKCKAVLDEICLIAKKKPDMMFIDAGGGADLVDRLHELGYEDRVKAIWFGSSPLDDQRYKNKRGEIWGLCNEWLTDENLEVQIPDDDELHADLIASPYDRDSHDRMVLWRKERIKSKYGYSPDDGDALCLTFAEPVNQNQNVAMNYKTPW